MNSSLLFGFIQPWMSAWLTPIWLIGVGALAGIVILLLLWAGLFVVSRDAARTVPLALGEGILPPILAVCGFMGVLGLVGVVVVENPYDHFHSVQRLLTRAVGTQSFEFAIAVPKEEGGEVVPQSIPVAFLGRELRELTVSCEEDLRIFTSPDENGTMTLTLTVTGGEDLNWLRGQQGGSRLIGRYDQLMVRNLGAIETTMVMTMVTGPVHPEVKTSLITAVCVVCIVLLYMFLRSTMPKVSAIALATAKSEMSQPVFLLLLVVGCFLLFLFIFLPYFTFDEDIKVLKDTGLALIMILCVFQAIWAASTSISEELEGRTALTVLSKPIGRRQFILGKFVGIGWTLAVMIIVLGVFFLFVVAYKPLFEARETSHPQPGWQICHLEMVRTVPGLVLAFLETMVIAALSVAISTRLPILPNFLICLFIYAAGHITPLIVQSSLGEFEPVQFVGQLIATVFPVLDHFNIQAAVAGGVPVPNAYLGMALVYCALYSTVAMLLALVLFEDRDLA